MSLVRGDNCIFYIFDAGLWKPYVCARSGNFSVDSDMIDTTVTGSGGWGTSRPGRKTFSAQFDGLISLNNPSALTLPELQAIQFSDTKLLCRFTETSEDHNIYTKEAYFYITNTTDTGAFDGVATFQVSMKGTGSITQVFILPPPIIQGKVYRYPTAGSSAPTTAGQTSITVAGLGNKDMLQVTKDGLGNNNIITSGTPVNKEVLYETSGTDGIFTWAIPFEDGENWYCLYQNL